MTAPNQPNSTDTPENGPESREYSVNQLKLLNDREHVRKRAGTYIGDCGTRGLHHLVHEVIDNSLDEAMAGHATAISVAVKDDHSITIADDGRGIPVAHDERIGVTALEGVMTRLKYGGKFDDSAYDSSGGLNGMGMKAVNFLSAWCIVQVDRDGHTHRQSYQQGVATSGVEVISDSDRTGTRVSFLPDPEKFGELKFDQEVLRRRLQTAAFLNRGVKIEFSDQRSNFNATFQYERGIIEWVEHQMIEREPIHPDIIYASGKEQGIQVEFAMQYTLAADEHLECYANNIHNEDGGTHQTGFRNALARAFMNFGRRENLFKSIKPIFADFREGLVAIVSVRLSQPQFESQHKIKLTTPDAEKATQAIVGQFLKAYCEEHPDVSRAVCAKAIVAAQARLQAKEIRKRLGSPKAIGGLPGKLRDCTSRDPEKCEVYLVEGDSAGGSAEGGRVREFQAILPLRGKIINALKYTADKVLANNEVQSIIQALRTGVGADFDLERLRYHKVIIMSDADVDGSHIRTLLLCFFYRQMPELIANGHVYIAQPPLFRLKSRKKNEYVQTEAEIKSRFLQQGLESATLLIEDQRQVAGPQLKALCEIIHHFQQLVRSLRTEGQSVTFANGSPVTDNWRPNAQASLKLIEQALGELGIPLSLLGPDQRVGADTPRMEAVSGDRNPRRTTIEKLTQLPDAIRSFGEQGVQVTRFKGLGEMNAEELRVTTLLPEKRNLVRITMEDAASASQMFQLLMGVSVEPRREFIQQNALDVSHLDV